MSLAETSPRLPRLISRDDSADLYIYKVAETSPQSPGDVVSTFSQSPWSPVSLGDVAIVENTLNCFDDAAMSPRPTGDFKKYRKSLRKNRTCLISQ